MAELEWWTTPGEAARRLQLLDDQMNALQNAALGRGVKPLVGPQLAQRVADEWTAYRNWRQTLGGLMLVSSWADDLGVWTRKANDLRAAIAAAGQPVPAALIQWETPGPAFVSATLGLAVAGLALVYALLRHGGGGNR
jgi:hypothetical protein